MKTNKLCYCPDCLGNDVTSKRITVPPNHPAYGLWGGDYMEVNYYTIYKGFVATYKYDGDNTICPTCNKRMNEMNLSENDWITLNDISLEQDFIFAMDQLKKDDIIEFTTKMTQFKEVDRQKASAELESLRSKPTNTPKCPTCGSPDIKKISAAGRYVSTSLFGLASSNIGKTMCCNSCGYKW